MAKAVPQKKTIPVQQPSTTKFWQHKYFNQWLVFLTAFLLFANSIAGGFNMDDELVTLNHRLTSKGLSAIPEIFTSPYYQDESGYSYEYRPLVLTSFAIEHQIFGDNAHVSHFFNVLLYALCCLLLLNVLLKLFKSYSPLLAMGVTLLFVVHPAHTEVVSSIKNRDEIIALIFSLLTLQVALIALEKNKIWLLVFVPVMFALALMGKVTVISFIVIIPLALLLFTNAGWRFILLTGTLLTIPSFFLVDLNSGTQKIMLLSGVLILTLIFYAILHFEAFSAALHKYLSTIKTGIIGNQEFAEEPEVITEEKPYQVKNILKGIAPDTSLFAFFPVITTGLLAGIYLLCIARFHSLLALAPISVLLLLAVKGERKMAWWAINMVGLCLAANVAVNNASIDERLMNLYCRLVGYYFVFQLYYGRRNLFYPTAILFVVFNIISVFLYKNVDSLFPLLIFLNFPYLRYAVWALLFFWCKDLFPFRNMYDIFELTGNLTAIVILLFVHFKKRMNWVPWLLIFSAFTWFHYSQLKKDRHVEVQNTVSAITDATNKVNPKIIATPQNRPLNFVEECIDVTTPATVRVGTSLQILYHYACKVAVPYPLSYYYGYKYIYPQKVTEALPMFSLLLHLVLFLLAMFFLRSNPLLSFGLFAYLVSIIVFANYVQPIPGMLADRFLLVPSLGWCIVLIVLLQHIFKINALNNTFSWAAVPRYGRIALAIILVIYGGMTFSRNFDWRDDLTLMEHDIKVVPQSAQANNLLGIHLVKRSFEMSDANQQRTMREEALTRIKAANAIFPGYFNFTYDIARVYTLLVNADSALVYYKQAGLINPDFTDVTQNVANIYFSKNEFNEAIPYFEKLVQKGTTDFSLYDKLSFCYFKINRLDLSIHTNQNAIAQLPGRVDPYINIATCYIQENRKDSALIWLNKALTQSPDNPAVIDYIGKMK